MCIGINHGFEWDRKGINLPPPANRYCNCGRYTYEQYKRLLASVKLPQPRDLR